MNTRLVRVTASLFTLLLASLVSQKANARWLLCQVKSSGTYANHQIDVRSHLEGKLRHFTIAMEPKGGPISPFTTAELRIVNGGKVAAIVPVVLNSRGGKLICDFEVSPDGLQSSTFTINEGSFQFLDKPTPPPADRVAKPHHVAPTLGGTCFQFELKNFATNR